MSASNGKGTAPDARALTAPANAPQERETAYLLAYAEQAEAAVGLIEQKIDGMKQTLADARKEAQRARAEADEIQE